jgi:hypothetical protein
VQVAISVVSSSKKLFFCEGRMTEIYTAVYIDIKKLE